MPKSSKRGGAKEHRKRVAKRNEQMKGLWQKQVNMAYEKHAEWKKQKELDANQNPNNQSISGLNFTTE
jgi:hypothetical protein